MINPALYYFTASALSISLNVNTGTNGFRSSETCAVSVVAGAAIKISNQLKTQAGITLNIGYNAQLGYRQFTFTGYNTIFGYALNGVQQLYRYTNAKIRVYIRVDASNNGSTGELIFLPYEVDYDGRILLAQGETIVEYPDITIETHTDTQGHTYYSLANTNTNNTSGLSYYYIHIGTIALPEGGTPENPRLYTRSWLNAVQSGQLETAKGNNEEGEGAWTRMFRLSPSNIIEVLLPFDKLFFQASGDTFINRITNQFADAVEDFGSFTEWAYNNTVATTKSVAAYIKSKIDELDDKYFRKDQPDTSPHLATFGDVHIQKDLPHDPDDPQSLLSNGNLEVDGASTFNGTAEARERINALKDIVVGQSLNNHDIVIKSSIYEAGFRGFKIDKAGNLEVESIKARSYIETNEMRINRLQAQEGDTIFSDNDQIEAVERQVDETDGSVTYVLTCKEKWEGYFTAQQYGNVCKGIINTLAEAYLAQHQGRQPAIDPNAPGQQQDAGGNKYFTSWFYIVGTHNTDNTLGLNQVRVVLYGENQILQDKNFAPCIGMTFARWGCINYADPESPDYETVLADIKRRQTLFYISVSEGRFMRLTGVYQPILENWMFGSTLGEVPDFIKNWTVYQKVDPDYDYLYAQGIIVNDMLHVGKNQKPVAVQVDCGEWVNGAATGTVSIDGVDYPLPIPASAHDDPDSPYIGHGIYLATEKNDMTGQYEEHITRHRNARWLCLQHQPVLDQGVRTYYEPKWNSPYWRILEGDEALKLEFVSSKGDKFRVGYVDTVITPHLKYGPDDISTDIANQYWVWTRKTDAGETDADRSWNALHQGQRVLTLTNSDMPYNWSRSNRAIFNLKVTVNDGKNTVYVENQVIV